MSRHYSSEECAEWRESHYDKASFTCDELEDRHQQWWEELDVSLQVIAVEYLRLHLPDEIRREVRRKFARYDNEWMDHMWEEWMDHMWEEKLAEEQKELEDTGEAEDDFPPLAAFYSFHMCEGMAVRNLLRKVIADDELPSGNWDDYYVAALLRARI